MHSLTLLSVLSAPLLALAKTDLSGCTSSIQGPSVIYYVPGTGELCEFLDCGGGRAPPKTTVPGCPLYSGTATYSPNYLAGFGPNAAVSTPAPVSTPAVVSPLSSITSVPSVSSSSLASSISSRATSLVSPTTRPFANSTVSTTSSRTSTLSSTRASNVTTGTATAFPGEAGHMSAKLGLIGFLGAVVALL